MDAKKELVRCIDNSDFIEGGEMKEIVSDLAHADRMSEMKTHSIIR